MKVHFFSKIDDNLIQYISEAAWKDNVLSFYENLEESKSLINLIVKPECVELIRDGEISSKFIFIENKITPVEYQTRYGNMNFDIHTKRIEVTKSKVLIEYDTIFDENSTSNVKIWLIIKENA